MTIFTVPTSADPSASLPTEVLLDIFKLVALDHITHTSACSIPGRNDVTGKYVHWRKVEDIDMRDDKLFPYNLANVCQRWNDIMHCCPEWWTRFRVFMDRGAPESILSDFSHQIELTQKVQPLRVFIGNSSKDVELSPQAERSIIDGIIEIVKAHLSRMESIVIQATHGSSLPLISSGAFSGPSPLLKELKLECASYPDIQSCTKPIRKLPIVEMPSRKRFPLKLTLGGPTFIDAIFVPEFWTNFIAGRMDGFLHISHLRADGSFQANEFMEVISFQALGIEAGIVLEDVEIFPSEEEPDFQSFEHIPTFVNFVGMSDFSFMLPLLQYQRLDLLCFDNCKITNVTCPSATVLYLENMAEDQDLYDAIIGADPTELCIMNCPSFDDYTLGVIGQLRGRNDDGVCHSLIKLCIEGGRTKITVEGLKRFIRGRKRMSESYFEKIGAEFPSVWDEDEWFNYIGEPTPLRDLEVRDAGYELSEEDVNFFTESVLDFDWSS